MHWITLPDAGHRLTPAFDDSATAKAWLAGQPATQPLLLLTAVDGQIEAIDGSPLPPSLRLELLKLLRTAAMPALEAITPRYLRKALPMAADDLRHFEVAQRLLLRLSIAYLRLIPDLAPAERSLPLNRAACALRMAQYCHFEAARECPVLIDQLLFAVLAEAKQNELLTQPLADPDFPHYGQANIAGHLAWAFILRLIDPYRLSAAQLTVANRAISRWRELAAFQAAPDDDPRAHSVDLSSLFGAALPAGIPRWLEVRRIVRKIDQRIAGLEGGETPESLKLGRELSAAACIRLLRTLESSLEAHAGPESTEVGEIELAFGAEHAYAVFTGEMLNAPRSLDGASASLAHQRMAMFGFDRLSSMPTAVKKLNVPGENWTLVDGRALRPADRQGNRRLSPCLIAAIRQGVPRLGVMGGLQNKADGALSAELVWYDESIEVCRLARPKGREQQPATPAFLLHDGQALSMIVPATAGIRLFSQVALEGCTVDNLAATEVLERGVDFVRYAIKRQ
jgi:hypothetical protein